MKAALDIIASLLPVALFLGGLVVFDSYKLVSPRALLMSLGAGLVAALCAYGVNGFFLDRLDPTLYTRYGAPVVEELLKALYVYLLVRGKKVGFMVDAAIIGFATGAGFAVVENLAYLGTLEDANFFLWIVRGFGTAVMHGGTTAIAGVIVKNVADTRDSDSVAVLLPGLAAAIVIHSLFNHFILPPVISTLLTVILLPGMLLAVFAKSEERTREWLGVGFDNDAELLTMITTGNIGETRLGRYLGSIQDRFRGEVVADMLCYLRLYLELAIQAKGILLMRESGFEIPPDPAISSKFDELAYLRKSIGPTGLLALSPFLRTSRRDLWQLHMLKG